MIPFRRRDFEVEAIAEEILRLAHRYGRMSNGSDGGQQFSWGLVLPPSQTQIKVVDKNVWTRRVHFVFDGADEAAASAVEDMRRTMSHYAPGLEPVDAENAEKVVILLTGGFLENTETITRLGGLAERLSKDSFVYLYSEPMGFAFSMVYGAPVRVVWLCLMCFEEKGSGVRARLLSPSALTLFCPVLFCSVLLFSAALLSAMLCCALLCSALLGWKCECDLTVFCITTKPLTLQGPRATQETIKVRRSIGLHECITHRALRTAEDAGYEHNAMALRVLELL